MTLPMKQEEKKVEYIELIYDLIFVYLIGRNNSLVSHVTNGFIDPQIYVTYLLCTLITIQIWYMTTLFLNRYGSNRLSEYTGLFINMFLLYYMADGTRVQWQNYYYRYNIAWALILLNLLVQYLLKYRNVQKERPWEASHILQYVKILTIQIGIIAAAILLYVPSGLPLAPAAMVYGMVMAIIGRKKADLVAVDFSHLTERVMLYIVFTFGEMIIAISIYFTGEITPSGIYYSVMAFLVVVGLFMSYGFYYDRLLDREMHVSGNTYMILHIFIIFALSNLTTAMEFQREPGIDALAKTIYLSVSFVVYFFFLFLTAPFTKAFRGNRKYLNYPVLALLVVAGLMIALYRLPQVGIALSVLLAFTVWFLERLYWKTCLCIVQG